MRLPNGYGSVVKMSGNRRRPYAVRKTDGFNEKGYPIYKIIGYTETKEEGLSLLALEKANIDLEARTMRGGGKTEAGKNRIVPIHNRIMHMIEHRMGLDGNLLFDVKITTYRMRWGEIMDRLGMHHTPHECRHTFRSRLDAAGANPKSCDLLMGHKSQDVGNRVYNHKTLEDLRTAIDLLE